MRPDSRGELGANFADDRTANGSQKELVAQPSLAARQPLLGRNRALDQAPLEATGVDFLAHIAVHFVEYQRHGEEALRL